MRAACGLLFGAWVMATAAPCRAALPGVAVADFGYEDTSGEARDETAQHARRLAALNADISQALAQSGRFQAGRLACGKANCSAEALDQADMLLAGKRQGARYVVFGGVHKMSTLIQWGRVDVMDTRTGGTALSRTVSFRGDSDDAWAHAGVYIGQMLVQGLK
jgi:hypothetical protein